MEAAAAKYYVSESGRQPAYRRKSVKYSAAKYEKLMKAASANWRRGGVIG